MVALATKSRNAQHRGDGAIDRDIADAVIARHQLSAPVNVVSIAADMGIAVYQDSLGPDISGIIRKDDAEGGDSGYVILVNEDHPINRQRFTVAHEIAHFVLHCGARNGEIKDDQFYRALPGPLEREANALAAEILMPWHLINALQAKGVTDLHELARALKVSRQALAIRLGIPFDQDWA